MFTSDALLPLGPFRGFAPFDEAAADVFFGRAVDTEALVEKVLHQTARVVTVTGESGVGKTSLVRGGLAPALRRRGIPVVYLGEAPHLGGLDAEILRVTEAGAGAGDRRPAGMPQATGSSTKGLSDNPSEGPSEGPPRTSARLLGRLAHDSRAGLVVVLDHLEEILFEGASTSAAAELASFVAAVAEHAGPKLHLVLVVDREAFARLESLSFPTSYRPAAGVWFNVERLGEAAVAEILERTAVHAGTFLEAGLPALIAVDLCKDQRALALELQLCARAMVDFRITTIRRYQSCGGILTLRAMYFEHAVRGGVEEAARGVLLDLGADRRGHRLDDGGLPGFTIDEIAGRTRVPRPEVHTAAHQLSERGLLRWRGPDERVALAHPALQPFVEWFGMEDRARSESVHRRLRARMAEGSRLTIVELIGIRRTLGSALSPAEQEVVGRSLRRHLTQLAFGAGLLMALVATVVLDSRPGYVLAFDPPAARGPSGGDAVVRVGVGPGGGPATAAASRVVVRAGRPRRGLASLFFRWSSQSEGAILADTGFSATALVPAAAARISSGQLAGNLDPARPGAVPNWLRDVINGLRPVPRGVAKALIGDADGVTSLKHAFSEPLTRRETLDALAAIGRGRAGEDEILSAALGDAAPEIRRRGVEVASAIDRRLGNGAHAAVLRGALGDKSPDVRTAVLREIGTLPPHEASEILAVALADRDPIHRKAAEEATLALAATNPEAAASAAEQLLENPDGVARRNGLPLLEQIASGAPAACAAVLDRLVVNPKASEEARVAALQVLRRAGPPAASLKPALEQAVGQSSSPRLRAAALPLYALLIEPTRAEEIARAEMKGPPAARAAATAIWGAVAVTRPDLATRPLKALVYDPSVEIRIEAARSFAYLKRDGLSLVDKALRDPNAEVERAATESALALAPINPSAVGTMLGKALTLVRPAVRRQIVEALGRLGETRPAAALPPLARALQEPDAATRTAVATAFCALARQNAVAASPYLRVAARDQSRDVRAAAAACLDDLVSGDPGGGMKMATELASSDEVTVRAAAASSLSRLAQRTPEVALGTLFKLLADSDPAVRIAAARGLQAFGESGAGGPGFGESRRGTEAERALIAALAQGDVTERRLVVAAAAANRLTGLLRQATTDGDQTVRLQAVEAAGKLAPPALDVVRESVDDRSPIVRTAATRILAGAAGDGAKEVLPIYEAALRGGDRAARQAAIVGLGELSGADVPAAQLLGEALQQRSESIRASAAQALGHLAERAPSVALPILENALHDPSYDVASAAVPGLALAWSRRSSSEALSAIMAASEADSARRFVALEALVMQAEQRQTPTAGAALAVLRRLGEQGPPMARLAAQLARAFLGTPTADFHIFLEQLLGG